MRLLKITLMIVLLLLTVSSITAYSPVEIKAVSPWQIESLPCRAVTYEFDIVNNDKITRKYHLSVDKYPKYVEFSDNDFSIVSGKSKRVAMYTVLPCSVSGEVILNLRVQLEALDYAVQSPFHINIKSDYTREISIAPLSVCKGEFGKGSLHILNPSTTPNLFLLTASLPRWMELEANKVLLPPNSQVDFNYTIYPDSKIGDHNIGFVIKDFSGTEEIPFTVKINDCENNFKLLDHKVLAVVGLQEEFKIPFTGLKDSMSFALQAPDWVTMEENLAEKYLTFEVDASDVVPGDYGVIVLAENGKTVSEKLVVSVTGSKIIKYLRSYMYYLLGLIVLIAAVGFGMYKYSCKMPKIKSFDFKKLKRKVKKVKVPKIITKKSAFDDFDFAKFELDDKVKILKKFDVDFEPRSWLWLWILTGVLGVLAILGGIGYVIWRYFGTAWKWLTVFLVPAKDWIISAGLIYWQYILGGLLVVGLVILLDKLNTKKVKTAKKEVKPAKKVVKKEFKAAKEYKPRDYTKLKYGAKWFGILVILAGIGYAIWKYGADLATKAKFLMPVYKWVLSAALHIIAYWQYILGGCAVVISVIFFDKLNTQGAFKKLYDYLFEEPSDHVEEKVFEIKEKKK